MIASHIGLNPETQQKMISGEIDVELVPQGTLVERIRAAGVGLGGILTPTGIGTLVEEGKQKITVDGKEYLLETPIHGDFALLAAYRADTSAIWSIPSPPTISTRPWLWRARPLSRNRTRSYPWV